MYSAKIVIQVSSSPGELIFGDKRIKISDLSVMIREIEGGKKALKINIEALKEGEINLEEIGAWVKKCSEPDEYGKSREISLENKSGYVVAYESEGYDHYALICIDIDLSKPGQVKFEGEYYPIDVFKKIYEERIVGKEIFDHLAVVNSGFKVANVAAGTWSGEPVLVKDKEGHLVVLKDYDEDDSAFEGFKQFKYKRNEDGTFSYVGEDNEMALQAEGLTIEQIVEHYKSIIEDNPEEE